MIPDVTTIDALAADWLALVTAVVWQSTLLAAVVAVVAWLLRRSSPAVRYWLWQIVAIKILLAPVWTLAVPIAWLPEASEMRQTVAVPAPDPARAALRDAPAAAIDPEEPVVNDGQAPNVHRRSAAFVDRARPIATPALSWQAWLMFAWLAIVVAEFALIGWQRWQLSELLRGAVPAEPALESLVAQCAVRVRLARPPRVLVTGDECSPFVCGAWRPAMVLPRSIVWKLSEAELRPVVVHELAHIKRLDLVWGWIPQLARLVYFFHPVAHWTLFRTRLEAELACDGYAMAATGHGASAYADLLVRVVSRLAEPAMLRTGSAASAGLDGRSPLETQSKEAQT